MQKLKEQKQFSNLKFVLQQQLDYCKQLVERTRKSEDEVTEARARFPDFKIHF